MSRVNNKEKYKEYDHNYYIKHKRPKSKIGQSELKITDLEAKLAEMTKKYELASCPTGGLVDRVRNLEQQLAENNEFFNAFACKDFNEFKDFISTFMLAPHEEQTLIRELKQQLEEKDKEIERLCNDCNKLWLSREQCDIDRMKAEINQTQLAIQELEKTLNFIEDVFDKALKNCSLNNGYYDQILDFIDQQIKELKGK